MTGWRSLSPLARVQRAAPATAVMALLVAGLVFVSALGLGNSLTFDEAYNPQVPLHLLRGAGYGTAIVGEWRPFDVRITTGPTAMLPAALLMVAFGPRARAPRAVIVAFWCACCTATALGLRRVAGASAAVLTVAGFLALGLYGTGSRFLGEVPALAFVAVGLLQLASDKGGDAHLGRGGSWRRQRARHGGARLVDSWCC